MRGGGGAQELTASAGGGAGPAAEFGSLFDADLAVGESRADGLDAAGVFALVGEESHAAGDQHAGEIVHGGERHHHGGQSFIAGGDADHAAARGEGADQAAEDGGGVVAVGEAVEHAWSALGAAVAGVGAIGGEGDGAGGFEFARGGFHEQADFPVAGVVAEGDGRAVGGADAAVGGEDEKFLGVDLRRVPAHAGVLGPAEEVAGGTVESISAVMGSEPAGPGAWEWMSKREGSEESKSIVLRVARLASAAENCGHHAGTAAAVHDGDDPERSFIWRVGDEVFMDDG